MDDINSIKYYLSESENNSIGWLGGNPPKWFDDKKYLIDENNCHYGFYCTFELIDTNQSMSIFIPEKSDLLLSNNIYPNCSLKAFIHPTETESIDAFFQLMPEKPDPNERLTSYQKNFDYSKPVLNKVYITSGNMKIEDNSAFVTIGEDVSFIQDEDYFKKALLGDGYELWGCISEEGYYPLIHQLDFVHGNMPLSDGAMYLYNKDNSIIVGYWQYG